jgi:hypothetical protein
MPESSPAGLLPYVRTDMNNLQRDHRRGRARGQGEAAQRVVLTADLGAWVDDRSNPSHALGA